jgi:serine/threonine protein kinase
MIRGLIIKMGSAEPRYYVLAEETVTIGRSPYSSLSFPESTQVSRQHASIQKREGRWVLVDLGSRNGTLLNGTRISKEMPLATGDRIEIGDLTIECTGEESSHQQPTAPPAAGQKPAPARMEFPGKRGVLLLPDPTPFAYGRSSVLFRATGTDGADLCVKLFPQVQGDTWDSVAAFEREVTAQSQLAHPHILPVVDYGLQSKPHGNPFVVFPFCEAGSLRLLLRERRYHPPELALPILEQLASALDFAHASGYVHGDVKPENMLFSSGRARAFLSDFGMSNVFAVQERFTTAVQGPQGGTTAYFSPELISDNQLTPLSDIYAFALTAYELLTGRLPFDPNLPTFKQMMAKVRGEVTDPRRFNPQIGDHARDALLAALHVDPLQRPRSAIEFCRRLSEPDRMVTATARAVRAGAGPTIFVSYSHKDERWLERVRVHLRPFERAGVIGMWSDKRIQPGDLWREEIEAALHEAKCAVLLLSANFVASDFCTEIELPALLERAQDRGVTILPIIVSPCQLDTVPGLSALQAVNSPSRTLTEVDRGEQERVLVALAQAVRNATSA